METKLLLKDFFSEDVDDNISNFQIVDGEKYTKIFSNIKEINENYFVRYNDISEIENIKIKAKFNGATGNYSAILTAFPQLDWQTLN